MSLIVRAFAIGSTCALLLCSSARVGADPSDRRADDLSFSTGDAGSTRPADREVEPASPEMRSEVFIGGFCGGGGGDDPLDEVQSLLDENRPAMARAQIGRVLREGVPEWDRARAFAMAGEIALRLGTVARAVAWYRDAVRISEEPADPTARLGLAVALLRSGRRAEAARSAQAVLGDECREDDGNDPMTCYGARIVAGLSARGRPERVAELARAREVREQNPEYDEMFVDFQRLLPAAGRAMAVQIASVRD